MTEVDASALDMAGRLLWRLEARMKGAKPYSFEAGREYIFVRKDPVCTLSYAAWPQGLVDEPDRYEEFPWLPGVWPEAWYVRLIETGLFGTKKTWRLVGYMTDGPRDIPPHAPEQELITPCSVNIDRPVWPQLYDDLEAEETLNRGGWTDSRAWPILYPH